MSLFIATTIRRYVNELLRIGVDDALVSEVGGVSAKAIASGQDCSPQMLLRLLEYLGRYGPADIGLRCGSMRRLAELGVVGHAIASSRTLGAALQISLAYGAESGALYETRYSTRGTNWIIEFRSAPGLSISVRRLVTEEWLATFFAYLAEVTEIDRPDARIEVDYAASRGVDYARWLPAIPQFGMRRCRVVLPASLLERDLVSYDHDMLHLILRHFEARPTKHDSASDRVRRYLMLDEGQAPGLEAAAAGLGTSSRTLTRRLADENTTFRKILDDYRRGYALALARDTRMGPKQISAALGYRSEQSFKRSFKIWTGLPLGRWRRLQKGTDD